MRLLAVLLAASALTVHAQKPCAPTPVFSPCEVTLELTPEEAARHPNPYQTVEAQAEFRSPRYKTFLVPAFYDGGRRLVVRFSPDAPGAWTFRLTGNIAEANDKEGTFEATPSRAPGFTIPANAHHWMYSGSRKAHLWMGDNVPGFAALDRAVFDRLAETRAAQHFNHLRGLVMDESSEQRAFPRPDAPSPDYFRELDARVGVLHRLGIATDLILGAGNNQLTRLFPTFTARERYLRYIVARYSAFNVTWQIASDFETYTDGREVVKQLGLTLKRLDPIQHPRATGSLATSSPLLGDLWVNYLVDESPDIALGAIERQLYTLPQVCLIGAKPADVWNATMNGQYPMFTGNPRQPDDAAAVAMKHWFEFMSRVRWWDVEPYFDLNGGRALALIVPHEDDEYVDGIEYVVYQEKPGPLEMTTVQHGYDAYWFDPAAGVLHKEKKDYKGTLYKGSPPDTSKPWVLHLSRDGKKEGMLRSVIFESRRPTVQEVEANPSKIPFELAEPAGGTIPAGQSVRYSVRLKRETAASRVMKYLVMGEVVRDKQGARVLAMGKEGSFTVPPSIIRQYPATMVLRVYGLNGVGKVYQLENIVTLVKP
jgi:hypothetical protein